MTAAPFFMGIEMDDDYFTAVGTLSAAHWMLTEFLQTKKSSTGINALIDEATGFDGFSREDKEWLLQVFEDIFDAKKILGEDTSATLAVINRLKEDLKCISKKLQF